MENEGGKEDEEEEILQKEEDAIEKKKTRKHKKIKVGEQNGKGDKSSRTRLTTDVREG